MHQRFGVGQVFGQVDITGKAVAVHCLDAKAQPLGLGAVLGEAVLSEGKGEVARGGQGQRQGIGAGAVPVRRDADLDLAADVRASARVLNRANLDGLGGDDVYWRSEKLARDEAG